MKKDNSMRICVDFRKLNATTQDDAYPMPSLPEMIETVGRAKIIGTLDMSQGYWQIGLSEEAFFKTAFRTDTGLYEFTVMPFGLKGALATFQRLVDDLLKEHQNFARAYLDDIAVFSNMWQVFSNTCFICAPS